MTEKTKNQLEEISSNLNNTYHVLEELYFNHELMADRGLLADWLDKVASLQSQVTNYMSSN